MADTTVSANNVQSQWSNSFFREYVRGNLFKPYMGMGVNSIIQINEDLTKKAGDNISFQLVSRLTGAGVTGNTKLEDAEEAIGNFAHKVEVTTYRNGVLITDEEQQKTNIQLLNEGRPLLMDWATSHTRDLIVVALAAISIADGSSITYASASEANRDTWLAANADRVLFGALVGNNAANDHSVALATIDNTADKLSAALVSLAKRRCKLADPHIRPFKVGAGSRMGEEWFVMFAHSLAFRNLKEDTVITQANREAWQRGADNPIFRDGDLLYDGVIIREVPEIAAVGAVGAAGIQVVPSYMCGAQAVGIGYAMRWKPASDKRDYGFRKGVAIQGNYGVEKLNLNAVQNGMHTVYTAGIADA